MNAANISHAAIYLYVFAPINGRNIVHRNGLLAKLFILKTSWDPAKKLHITPNIFAHSLTYTTYARIFAHSIESPMSDNDVLIFCVQMLFNFLSG